MKLFSFPTLKLPSISRFITEFPLKKSVYVLAIGLSFILSMLIVLKLFDLGQSLRTLQMASAQEASTRNELAYWEEVVGRFPGYRDAYFRAYLAAAKLSEEEKAQRFMGELLRIDPGFQIPSGE